MCLYSWESKKKAENDIVCYKVIKYDDNGILSSPIQGSFKWELGKEYRAERAIFSAFGCISKGYFHSYISEWAAFNAQHSSLGCFKETRIFKCIIPKGTYFYQGIHSDGREGYASKSLKIVEIL